MKREDSTGHKRCEEVQEAKEKGTRVARATLQRMPTDAQALKDNTVFRTAHAIGKKCRPFTDFAWISHKYYLFLVDLASG